MTAVYFQTRVDLTPGRVLIEVDVLPAGEPLTDERMEHLRAQLQDALEPVLDDAWNGRAPR